MRGIFFASEDAEAVAAALRASGWAASVAREPFAGEDDAEDHPWAVLTDAPEPVLEVLTDDHDGWLDREDAPAPAAPLELPTAPRRIKRPS
jgi:hypothetical protein